ncbi:hypothetical protein UPYG_G00177190 [Umbra pygmaea]|uniref:ITPR-interacting domain-containing protein n=1 Tax=Umbra pygmaea TaxID=75934 RepID=A0ABD0XF53_UMBPY
MDSPSSTARRRAWGQTRRQWLTLEEQDSQESGSYTRVSTIQLPENPHSSSPLGPPSTHPFDSHQTVSEDDVFTEGCSAGKIKSWLLGCGLEKGSENLGHNLVVESLLKSNSFEDDLSLGAEASALNVGGVLELRSCPMVPSPPKHTGVSTSSTPRLRRTPPLLDLGHSMASSTLSYSTSKVSFVSEVLQLYAEDAEETLCQLGFGCDEPDVTARIPPRFLNFPSQLNGINFRLFLQSQLNRLRQEDPGLSLASRFRQVEVLTAMANAFYSLYSHVSRTPLQKLAPPEFSFSPTGDRQIGRRFMGSVRSEPRSPVERLKDTVSKMCLYTGSGGSPRLGSDSVYPGSDLSSRPRYGSYSKKRNSLPDLVGLVMENAKAEAVSRDIDCLDTGRVSRSSDALDLSDLVKDRDTETWGNLGITLSNDRGQNILSDVQVREMLPEGIVKNPVDTHMVRNRETQTTKAMHKEYCSNRDGADSGRDTDKIPSLGASGQMEPASRKKLDFCLTSSRPSCEVGGAVVAPFKITHDVICPQIVESVHLALYGAKLQQRHNNDTQSVDILTSGVSTEEFREFDQSFAKFDHPHKPSDEKKLTRSQSPKCQEVVFPAIPTAESEGDLSLGRTGKVVDLTAVAKEDPNGRKSPCLITVTDVTCCFGSADTHEKALNPSNGTTAVHTGAEYHPNAWRNKRYLSPHILRKAFHSLQEANSFELEEVHSAGEEDFGQQETIRSIALSSSKIKGLVVRGDSMQSDSSGYADEDFISSAYSPGSDKS